MRKKMLSLALKRQRMFLSLPTKPNCFTDENENFVNIQKQDHCSSKVIYYREREEISICRYINNNMYYKEIFKHRYILY